MFPTNYLFTYYIYGNLAINNPQELVCHKTDQNELIYQFSSTDYFFVIKGQCVQKELKKEKKDYQILFICLIFNLLLSAKKKTKKKTCNFRQMMESVFFFFFFLDFYQIIVLL